MKYSILTLLILLSSLSFSQKKVIKAIYVEYDYSKMNLDPNTNQYGRLFPDTFYFDSLGRKIYENIGGDGFGTNINSFIYKNGKLVQEKSESGRRSDYFYSTHLDSTKGYGQFKRLLGEHYFTYDDSGRVAFQRGWYPVLKRGDSSIFEYGPNWVREHFYSTPVKSYHKQTFYNEYKDPVEEYTFNPERTYCEKYEYTYDSHGNWITKTTKSRFKNKDGTRTLWRTDHYIIRRKIVYY